MNMVDRSAGGFASSTGIVLETVTPDRVTASLELEPRHLQPMGIVHGGVYCTMIETVASVGAALSAMEAGKTAAGIENHTSFLRSINSGRIHAVADVISKGRQMHLWQVEIRDDAERLVARGTVRLALLEPRPEGA